MNELGKLEEHEKVSHLRAMLLNQGVVGVPTTEKIQLLANKSDVMLIS